MARSTGPSSEGAQLRAHRPLPLDCPGRGESARVRRQALVDQVRAEAAARSAAGAGAAALRARLRRLQALEAHARAALLPGGGAGAAAPSAAAAGAAPAGAPASGGPGPAAAPPPLAAGRPAFPAKAHQLAAGGVGPATAAAAAAEQGAAELAGSPERATALARILTPPGEGGAGSPNRSGTPPQVGPCLQAPTCTKRGRAVASVHSLFALSREGMLW